MNVLAVSWAMPPMLFPRSIQVSRLLGALSGLGRRIRVIHADAGSPGLGGVPLDATLAQCLPGGFTRSAVSWHTPPERWEEGWVRAAVAQGEALLAKERFDVLVSFAQPWSDHDIGWALKQKHGLPWVAHFSDPWVDSPYAANMGQDERRRYEEAERRCIGAADAVVFTNQRTLDLVMGKYPEQWRAKAHVVFHGFDGEMAARVEPAPKGSGLRISHVGNLFEGSRTQGKLFEAFAQLSRVSELAAGAELAFLGIVPDSVRREAESYGFGGRVRFEGMLPFREAQAWMASSDILLTIDKPGDNNVFFPSKLVEYMAWRKPVLGLTPADGVTADILAQFGWPVVEPGDAPGIAAALGGLMEQVAGGKPPIGNEELLAPYDIRSAAARMNEILLGVLGDDAPEGPLPVGDRSAGHGRNTERPAGGGNV